MANKVTYHKVNDNMEYVYYHDSTQTYSIHTHTEHATIGYIISGSVKIVMDGQEFIYHATEYFCIMPDVAHAIDTDNDNTYDQSHFDRCFHKIVGLTPNEYKQSVKKID